MVWTVLGWILLALAALLAAAVAFVLFAPLRLEAWTHPADGGPGFVRLSWSGALRAWLRGPAEDPELGWRAAFWSGRWRPLSEPLPLARRDGGDGASPERAPRRRRGPRWRPSPARLWILLDELSRAGRVRRFRLELDTGDWVLNAQLYPLAAWAAARGWQVGIRFDGQTLLELDARLRPARVLRALLRGFARRANVRPGPAALGRRLGSVFFHPPQTHAS